jgi:hypothetical protein
LVIKNKGEVAGDGRCAHLEINALVQQAIVTDERRRAAEEMTSRWTQLSAADEILQIGDNGPS